MTQAPDSPIGALEASGTKFVCAVGTAPASGYWPGPRFRRGERPAELLAAVVGWLKEQEGWYGRRRARRQRRRAAAAQGAAGKIASLVSAKHGRRPPSHRLSRMAWQQGR